jgi:membrane protease YdiL (CAAX protease family)
MTMSDTITEDGYQPPETPGDGPLPDVAPAPRRPRSWAWLAWVVILTLCGYMAFGRTLLADKEEEATRENRLGRLLIKMQGRYAVGAEDILKQNGMFAIAEAYRRGDVEQRLRFVVLAGELAGPEEALKELDRLDKDMTEHGVKATQEQAKTRELLGRLYRDYRRGRLDAPSLDQTDRAYLRKQLDWFGDLALAPPGLAIDNEEIAPAAGGAGALALAKAKIPSPELRRAVIAPARRTFGVLFGGAAAVVFLAFFGLIGLIVLFILTLTGHVRSGVQTGTGRGSIYAETFAAWLVLFLGLSFAASHISLGIPPLLQLGLFMFLSLAALGWPVLRGVPWRNVREDVGLTLGRNPILEPAIGVACYAMALPILFGGIIVTLLLYFLQQSLAGADGNPFSSGSYPSHPIVGPLAQGTLEDRILVIVLASLVAPIVEETMFRGVLYRHLREATARFGGALSFIISAAVVSFLFAVIHPQGIIAVPVLMALAFGFVLARQWRGTLIPGMIGHALNNGLVTLLLLAMLAD